MLFRPILFFARRVVIPPVLHTHTKTCPASKKKKVCLKEPKPRTCPSSGSVKSTVCPSSGGGGGGGGGAAKLPFQRAIHSGKCRLGFIPEEWFLFFHKKTGVTGPYLFLITLSNYLLSKEIYVLEHEYYLGVSAFIMVFYATKTFGKDLGASLDKQVDEYAASLEVGRKAETDFHNNVLKMATDAQKRAQGQKLLMDAKKENVLMQIEAIYRERAMLVYSMVRGRMDYHIKMYQAEARIHQKWMLKWILENVHKSITPEFQQQALQSAINDLSALAASRAK